MDSKHSVMSNLPARPTVVSATDPVAREPVGAMHGCMVLQPVHAASPVCSIGVHRVGLPLSEALPVHRLSTCPAPPAAWQGQTLCPLGTSRLSSRTLERTPGCSRSLSCAPASLRCPWWWQLWPRGPPTSSSFSRSARGGAMASSVVQVQMPCSFDPSALQTQDRGPVATVYRVIAHARFAVCKGLAL